MPKFEILKALYVVHFSILPTGAPFQIKIPKYLSSRIFFLFRKLALVFLKKNQFIFRKMKNPENSIKNTFPHIFDGEVIFWKFWFLNFLRFNENFGKFSKCSKKLFFVKKQNDGFIYACKILFDYSPAPIGWEIKIQIFFILHFSSSPQGSSKNSKHSAGQILSIFELKRCPSRQN